MDAPFDAKTRRPAAVPAAEPHDEGRRLAQRVYMPRIVGLALGALCVGGGLWQLGAPGWLWALLIANAFAWPHVAYALARRSAYPGRTERRSLIFDSACGGAWVAAMGFNLVPSAVLVSMLAMDKAAIGGIRFLVRCVAAQALAAAAVALATGLRLEPRSALPAVLASVPLLLVHPVIVGLTAYRLARRARRDNRLLAALSTMDGLTGVLNRAGWEQAAQSEFQRCRRIGHSAALLMLDLDHFKTVNDRHGHAAGDAALRAVADVLRRSLRLHDLAGRYGGEEFGILLPGADAAGAAAIAERLRRRIASLPLEVPVTASIGYAALEPEDESHTAWIGRADRALYEAKEAGRNRAVAAAPARKPSQP